MDCYCLYMPDSTNWPKIETPQALDPIKYRAFSGCISQPITFTLDNPFNLSVDCTSSVLNNNKITKVELQLKKTGSPLSNEWENIFGKSDTVNVTYKLGDGTILTMNDVKFTPESSTGTTDNIRITPQNDHIQAPPRIDEPNGTEGLHWITLQERGSDIESSPLRLFNDGVSAPPPMIYDNDKLYVNNTQGEWVPISTVDSHGILHCLGPARTNPWNPSEEKEDDTDVFSISEQLKDV